MTLAANCDICNNIYSCVVADVCVYSEVIDMGTSGGTLSPQLGALTDLEVLAVGNNKLTGTLPPQLSLLTKMIYMGTAQRSACRGDT